VTKQSRVAFPFALLRFWLGRILWLWFLVGSLIFIIQLIECGIAQDNEKVRLMLDLFDRMPSFMTDFIGGDILQVGNVTGFIAIGYQHPLVLISYMIFAVCTSTGLLTGHVQNGTMELILSRSVTKNQVYMCACILTLAGMLAIVMVMFTGTVVGVNIYDFEQEVSLWPFFKASLVGSLLAGAAAGLSLLAAVSFRSRSKAVGLAITFFIVNDFIYITAEWWPPVEFLGPISLFYYDTPWKILLEPGWPIRDMCVLSSVLVVAVVSGGIIWNRRDLPL
jgi:ABC-type transport system involved in multi-copper enzyme maturation permease subunit